MEVGNRRGLWNNWALIFLPSLIVLFFHLLHRRLPAPTAGGLSFLAVILLALLLFPKIKINFVRLFIGVIIALVIALTLSNVRGFF